jgi:hypothetical protein
MSRAMGLDLNADDEKRVDYGPLLGFGTPAVRIDPHSHEARGAPQTDLRQVSEIVRDRRLEAQRATEPHTPDKPE